MSSDEQRTEKRVLERRDFYYFRIQNVILTHYDLSLTELALYMWFAYHAGASEGQMAYKSGMEFAQRYHVTRGTVYKAAKRLTDLGLIRQASTTNRGVKLYELLQPDVLSDIPGKVSPTRQVAPPQVSPTRQDVSPTRQDVSPTRQDVSPTRQDVSRRDTQTTRKTIQKNKNDKQQPSAAQALPPTPPSGGGLSDKDRLLADARKLRAHIEAQQAAGKSPAPILEIRLEDIEQQLARLSA